MDDIRISFHGRLDTVKAFNELASVLSNFYAHKLDHNGEIVRKQPDYPSEHLEAGRCLVFHMHHYDGPVCMVFEPEGTIAALMECGRRNYLDITVTHTSHLSDSGDGYVSFVRGGGDPITMPIIGGEIAVTATTMAMLKKRGMCSVETIGRLLAVKEDALNLPRFTLSDEVVEAAAPARGKSM